MRKDSTEKTVRKRPLDVTSFASATKIVVAVNSITGLRPLHYSDTRFWTFLNYSYRMMIVTTVGYVTYWIYVNELSKQSYKVDRVVYLSLKIMNYLCYVCIQVLACYYSDDIPGLKRRITDLEENFAKLGAVVNNRNVLLWIIGTYGVSILYVSIVFISCGYLQWSIEYTFHLFFFSYITNIGTQVLLDFLTYACWLKFSFKETNDLLQKFLVEGRQIKTGDLTNESTEAITDRVNVQKYLNKWMPEHSFRRTRVAPLNKIPSVKHELQAVKKVHMLQEIRCIHLHLCRILKTMNRAFDAQVMVYSFVIIINIVAILYYVYSEFRKFSGDPSGVSSTSVPVLDMLYTCTKITIICYVCEDTVKEMKKVVEIIHECSISDFDIELKDEIWQFSLQLSLNQVSNVKSDYFRLNFNFMRQCISSITTYLVIIIQWAQSIKTEYPLGLNATQSFQTQFDRTNKH